MTTGDRNRLARHFVGLLPGSGRETARHGGAGARRCEPASFLRSLAPVGLALAALVFGARGAVSAELLVFEQPGCPFCRAFETEIAPDYADSRAGAVAPLRRVDIHADRRGGLAGVAPAAFTPTFVLVTDAGREVGRLTGYPGEKYFYPEIERLLDRLAAGETGPRARPEAADRSPAAGARREGGATAAGRGRHP